jgi:predicted RNase H-like nuclease (RuvC/YqgF family)
MEEIIFEKVNTAYEDENGRNVCGCCGSYYVVTPRKVKEIEERLVKYKNENNKLKAEIAGLKGQIEGYKKSIQDNMLTKEERDEQYDNICTKQ